MRVIITGAKGQLGNDLAKAFAGEELSLWDIQELDITDFAAVSREIGKVKPHLIINSAAYTNVDGCESEMETAFKINAVGTQNLAIAARANGSDIVYVSTDFVFDGDTSDPYTEFDDPNPLSVYGRSKLAGERYVTSLTNRHYIVRTAWLYGHGGNNFVKTIIKLARERDQLRIVNDQIGSPTYSLDLAYKIAEISRSGGYGIYHATNSGSCSWYDFTLEILRHDGSQTPVVPIASSELNRPAPRPAFSELRNLSLELRGLTPMRPWQEALADYFAAAPETTNSAAVADKTVK